MVMPRTRMLPDGSSTVYWVCDLLGRYDGLWLECEAQPPHTGSHVATVDGDPVFWGPAALYEEEER